MLDERRLTVRLPGPVADWLIAAKDAEGSTVNFEIIRSVRERMQRAEATTGESLQAHPAAADHEPALSGGPVTQAPEMPR